MRTSTEKIAVCTHYEDPRRKSLTISETYIIIMFVVQAAVVQQ